MILVKFVPRDRMKEGLTHLGDKEPKPITSYTPQLLEKIENRYKSNDYWVSLDCFEFTVLCPITNQPDFGRILINYIPDEYLIESKSLKLYIASFRNHGDFSEDVSNMIMNDIIELIKPRYIELRANFNSRGGISINPFVNHGKDETWMKFAEKRLQNYEMEKD